MSQDLQRDTFRPGPIALFGSGETSPSGHKIFEYLFNVLPPAPHVALLETPAGFELNSDQVIGRIGEFLEHHLQNFDPQIEVIPARRRGTFHSPDNPNILEPLLNADLVFMGPGSPTYAIRQLRNSVAWQMIIANHYLGGTIALASAATIAISSFALPVYEIYKVGEDLHWKEGLDFFGLYGLSLAFVPHWNNNDGGDELDTSRCFMGIQRFSPLLEILPTNTTVLGIDELTALIIEPDSGECRVIGKGRVILLPGGKSVASDTIASDPYMVVEDYPDLVRIYHESEKFSLAELGTFHPFDPEAVLPRKIWLQALIAKKYMAEIKEEAPPEMVVNLVRKREKARSRKDWETADSLRDDIANLGWEVVDSPDGPQINKTDH
jgi:hypothetical protein